MPEEAFPSAPHELGKAPQGLNLTSDQTLAHLRGEIEKLDMKPSRTLLKHSQVGGTHYDNMAISPLEYIEANELDFAQGNVIKYVSRYKEKNGLEDLLKAEHYIQVLIERYKKEQS
jgi:hypothetical protein